MVEEDIRPPERITRLVFLATPPLFSDHQPGDVGERGAEPGARFWQTCEIDDVGGGGPVRLVAALRVRLDGLGLVRVDVDVGGDPRDRRHCDRGCSGQPAAAARR